MARRGSTGFTNTVAAANTGAITISSGWTTSNPSVGDTVLLFYTIDKSSAAPSITGTTFSAVTGAADINTAGAQGTITNGVKSRIWDGTETTVQLATSGSHFYAVTLLAYSGRSSTPFAVTPAITGPVALGGGSPQALTITSLTANTSDDIVLYIGGNSASTTTDPYTLTPPTGFGNTLDREAAATLFATQHSTADLLNVSAGSVPTTGAQLANGSGTGICYCGYLISLALPPAAPPIPPYGPMPKQIYIMP